MCGIAGILAPRGGSADRGRAERMAALIRHRGPDDGGVRASPDGRSALASRRLAILDLSADGRMPLANETADAWVAFNGEIYNHRRLRHELEVRHDFRSRSDTEAIVHAFEEWGLSFLERLEGMFALAVYDERQDLLVLARDRCGEKPLYYAWEGETLVFASEIKAIVETSGRARRIDPESLSQYLTFGFAMPPRTLLAGISKLAPGEALVVERGVVRLFSYWRALADPDMVDVVRRTPPAEHALALRRLLEQSVQDRMAADVPVGAFLSGGVDSSAVVALMSRLSGRPVETVTVANEDAPELDESRFAERVAREVGAVFHRVAVRESEAVATLPEIVWHMDEPVSDPAALNTWFASKRLRQEGVIVSLVGEGADEIFLGYPNYLRFARLARASEGLSRLPRPVRRIGETLGGAALKALGGGIHRDLLRRALRDEALFLGTELFFQDVDKWPILGPSSRAVLEAYPSAPVAAAVQANAPAPLRDDPLGIMSFSETRMRMAEKLLMRVDKMSMAHGIEIRAPFLDHRLVEYALSIPSSLRAAGGVTKRLLKEAVADLVPAEIRRRPKSGFSTPIATWLRGGLGRHFESHIASASIFRDGILDADAARRLLAAHRRCHRNAKAAHVQLWNLVVLTEWYDRFAIDGLAFSPIKAAAE
jgi:asparagine synthase (glutamine-hydrolysing)